MPAFQGPFPDNPMRNERRGLPLPLVPVRIGIPVKDMQDIVSRTGALPKGIATWALLDTGSGSCLMDPLVAEKLKLRAVDNAEVRTVNAVTRRDRYLIDAAVSEEPLETLLVAEAPMAGQGYHLLLGFDWLSKRSFQIGPGPAFTLSW